MRIVTAIVGIPVVVALVWLGGWPFGFLVMVIAMAGQHELYGLFRAKGTSVGGPWALAAGGCAALGPMHPAFAAAAIVLLLVALSGWPLAGRVEGSLAGVSGTVLGVVYPPILLSALTALRTSGMSSDLDPFVITLGVIVLVWAADTGAYYAGKTLGRHLLAPRVSPKKTWEGIGGGVVTAIVVAWCFARWVEPGLELQHWLVLGLVAATVGPVGDLFESALKRDAGVKDSAGLLPGHGGFLDRFDALAFVAPVSYLYLRIVAGIFG